LVHRAVLKSIDRDEEARAAKLQGTATVYVEINELGIPEKVEVLQGLGLGLDERAVALLNRGPLSPAPGVAPRCVQL